MLHPLITKTHLSGLLILTMMFASCSNRKEAKDEQISVSSIESNENDSISNSIEGNLAMAQIATSPANVILTGLQDHRLVTVYKTKEDGNSSGGSIRKSSDYGYDDGDESTNAHFMPGIDILYGYKLLNIAHFDLKTEKQNFLFNHPVLIKTLYYPCFVQDSLDRKPINRDYFMVSVYDEDTNKDTLLNRKDLRHMYLFDASCSVRTQLLPKDYSVIRSEYDSKNDAMYIFARHDADKNGTADKKEPVHIFWLNLKTPAAAKRLY